MLTYASAVKTKLWLTKWELHKDLQKLGEIQVLIVLPHFLSGGGTPNPRKNMIFGIPEFELTSPKKKN